MSALAFAAVMTPVVLLQLGPVALLAGQPLTAPVLPVALAAAWGAVRDPGEGWLALPLAATVLGALSEERVGWFLIALLPAAALPAAAAALEGDGPPRAGRRLLTATVGAVLASLWYAALLATVAGRSGELRDAGSALALAAITCGVVAVLLAAALWPLRPRPSRGWFD